MITGRLPKIYDAPFFSVVCFDAKINFDDNAAFRQKEIFAMDDMAESDPREVEAHKHNLNYIAMDGNIACLGEVLFRSRQILQACLVQCVILCSASVLQEKTTDSKSYIRKQKWVPFYALLLLYIFVVVIFHVVDFVECSQWSYCVQ